MKNPNNPNPVPRPAPSRCFGGIPSKRNTHSNSSKKATGPFRPRPSRPVRLDDFVTDCVELGFTESFISENATLPPDVWKAPSAADVLKAISSTILNGLTKKGENFGKAMTSQGRALFVGVVRIQSYTQKITVPGGLGFMHRAVKLPCHSVEVLLSKRSFAGHPKLEMPSTRWSIVCSKFSLPSRRKNFKQSYVEGPYLAVIFYEPTTGVVARARLWPAEFSGSRRPIHLVRSSLERAACRAYERSGAVLFTPIRKGQLRRLQMGLGHRWVGDLSEYQYQPDEVLMPRPSRNAIVSEIFGIRGVKKYDATKTKKKKTGLGNPAFSFVHIEGRRLTPSNVADWAKEIVENPKHGVWRSPGSHARNSKAA